jgi:hypothetical protein
VFELEILPDIGAWDCQGALPWGGISPRMTGHSVCHKLESVFYPIVFTCFNGMHQSCMIGGLFSSPTQTEHHP